MPVAHVRSPSTIVATTVYVTLGSSDASEYGSLKAIGTWPDSVITSLATIDPAVGFPAPSTRHDRGFGGVRKHGRLVVVSVPVTEPAPGGGVGVGDEGSVGEGVARLGVGDGVGVGEGVGLGVGEGVGVGVGDGVGDGDGVGEGEGEGDGLRAG